MTDEDTEDDDDDEDFDTAGQKVPNPTPQEIAETCLQIQADWSDGMRVSRLRSDWRPSIPQGDGSTEPMSCRDVVRHHRSVQRNQAALGRDEEPAPDRPEDKGFCRQCDDYRQNFRGCCFDCGVHLEFGNEALSTFIDPDFDDDEFERVFLGYDHGDEDSAEEVEDMKAQAPPKEAAVTVIEEPIETPAAEPEASEDADTVKLRALEDEHGQAQAEYSKAFREAVSLLRRAGMLKPDSGIPPPDSEIHQAICRDESVWKPKLRARMAWDALKTFRDELEEKANIERHESGTVLDD